MQRVKQDPNWPMRDVELVKSVENTFDNEDDAFRITLGCKHWLVATGSEARRIITLGRTFCRDCGLKSQSV